MIKNISLQIFRRKDFLRGHIELTYRCNFNCVHCYCKGLEDKEKELNVLEWKHILDKIWEGGCLYLVFSGGEPLIREDFLEIYSYAKKKGFIVTIFTNGQLFTQKLIKYLIKYPPSKIEITLPAITNHTYESITKVSARINDIVGVIKDLKRRGFFVCLKTPILRQNQNEILRIGKFSEEILSKKKGVCIFRYDLMIFPRLNGDITPLKYRISPEAHIWFIKQRWSKFFMFPDYDFSFLSLERDKKYLYQCNIWREYFFINPSGELRFCLLSNKFGGNLLNNSFRKCFYEWIPNLLYEEFRTNSKCKECQLRSVCYWCPSRAYLEVGNEEGHVKYYCNLAKKIRESINDIKLIA
ncbi:MAG: radical SAM protein [Candidatus Omnitrophica bacterium]|nr:radical SAM protein [Candidatus Omnitrophota bacterium]